MPRPKPSSAGLSVLVAAIIFAADNATFLGLDARVFANSPLHQATCGAAGFAVVLFTVSLLGPARPQKPCLIFVLLVSAGASCHQDSPGVRIDLERIQNAFHYIPREAGHFITLGLLTNLTFAGQLPSLLGLVIGESARAKNFGPGGYPRPTTPERLRHQAVFFDTLACGTSTAVAVPCMMSHLPQANHSFVFQRISEPVGIIAPVCEHPLRLWQADQKGRGTRVIADLTCGHEEADRAVLGIGDGMQLGIHAALGAPDKTSPLVAGPPFFHRRLVAVR